MWNRAELKERAKRAFRFDYGYSVLVALIMGVVGGGVSAVGSIASFRPSLQFEVNNQTFDFSSFDIAGEELMEMLQAAAPVILTGALIGGLVALALSIFVFNPLLLGCRRYFFVNRYCNPAETNMRATLDELGFGFKNNYKNIVATLFLEDLFIFLWSLLFIIPGIVKTYAYRLVPYILAEDPNLSSGEALRRSEEMMRGHKWDAFVLDLSFLGWEILSAFTLGILGILFVNPYVAAADAELYCTIREMSAPAQPADTNVPPADAGQDGPAF